jgi:hypothetical protein
MAKCSDERIDVNNYTTPFTDYTVDFHAFVHKNGIEPPAVNTQSGQGIALLTCEENRGKYALREDLETFFTNIGRTTGDAIQSVNKCEQWGLKRNPTRGKYSIPFPFEYIKLHVMKRKNAKIGGDKDEIINATKEFIKVNYLDVPNSLWQVGHKDPNNMDNTSNNLIYQPPIQGKYRDRYKFDNLGLTKYPTIAELNSNMQKYYTDEEETELYHILEKRQHNKKKENLTSSCSN